MAIRQVRRAECGPRLYSGACLHSSDGPQYAPSSPWGDAVGADGGYGYNCLVRSLARISRDDRSAPAYKSMGARCASARKTHVAM